MPENQDKTHASMNESLTAMTAGTTHRGNGTWEFVLWAPKCSAVNLHLIGSAADVARPAQKELSLRRHNARYDALERRRRIADPYVDRYIEMQGDDAGYFRATVDNVPEDCLYTFGLVAKETEHPKITERPDPASRFQPEGVHGPSQLVDLDDFSWTDQNWKPGPFERSIFYELHVGTFTPAGTLDAIIEHLPKLRDLGITTIELMPLAQFPGARNWGYDGVYPYAVQNSYGGPRALQRFVDAAHAHGLSVAVDVVYNHFGPEGNYLSEFGPYFTDRYATPWGDAINFDEAQSDPVREFFIGNALYWIEKYHVDVLRLDAIQEIFDFGAIHFLAELQERVLAAGKKLGKELVLVGECDLNDSKIVRAREIGGHGIRAQWSDDFHHSIHALMTPERHLNYADFGSAGDLATILEEGWLYSGQHSKYRKRNHGNSARGLARSKFVVFSQNHDQVGNRAHGERLAHLAGFELQKLAAGATLLSPFVPLLFMGEEYGEVAPFLYFTDHGDESLIEAVRTGRRTDFGAQGWHGNIPDPQDIETFRRSTLQHASETEPHVTLRKFYKALIQFRNENELGSEAQVEVAHDEKNRVVTLIRNCGGHELAMIFNFGEETIEHGTLKELTGLDFVLEQDRWSSAFDSADAIWLGPKTGNSKEGVAGINEINVAPKSFVALRRRNSESET